MMRRLVLIVITALLSLSAVSITAAAPVEDLNALARYYPEETWVFAAMRTDSAYVDELNALYEKVLDYLPAEARPPFDLQTMLDMSASELGVGSFEEGVRPWLGDTGALGVWMPETDGLSSFVEPVVLVAAEITDQAGAEAFAEAVVLNAGAELEPTEVGNYTVYEFESNGFIVIGEDVLFITTTPEIVTAGVDNALGAAEDFQTNFASLPADDYSITAYINTVAINEYNFRTMGEEVPGFVLQLLEASGSQVFGVALGDDTLTVDVAVSFDAAALEAFGIEMMSYDPEPVDLSFANRIPADAPLVMFGTDQGQYIQSAFDSLRQLSQWFVEQGGLGTVIDPNGEMMDEQERRVVNALDPSLLLGFVNLPFAGLTGLSLERDVLPVLDGQTAAYVRARPVDDFMIPLVPDLAILYSTSDTEGALNIVDTLTESMNAYDLAVESEDYGTGRALVFPSDLVDMDYSDLDILVAASDGLLALGVRPAVQAALNESGGLADNPTFQAASEHFLPGAQQILFASSEPVYGVVDFFFDAGFLFPSPDIEAAYRAGSLLESAAFSSVTLDSGNGSQGRLVISLSDAPRELLASQN